MMNTARFASFYLQSGVAHLPAFSLGLLRPARQRGQFGPLCDLSTPSQKGNASRSFTMRLRCMPTNYSHFQRRPFLLKRGVSAPFPKPGRGGEACCVNVRLVTRCSAGRALVWGMCKRPGDLMISRRFCRGLSMHRNHVGLISRPHRKKMGSRFHLSVMCWRICEFCSGGPMTSQDDDAGRRVTICRLPGQRAGGMVTVDTVEEVNCQCRVLCPFWDNIRVAPS